MGDALSLRYFIIDLTVAVGTLKTVGFFSTSIQGRGDTAGVRGHTPSLAWDLLGCLEVISPPGSQPLLLKPSVLIMKAVSMCKILDIDKQGCEIIGTFCF